MTMGTGAYPPITEHNLTALAAIKQMAFHNPGWLDAPGCPYPLNLKLKLKELLEIDSPTIVRTSSAAEQRVVEELDTLGNDELIERQLRKGLLTLMTVSETMKKDDHKALIDVAKKASDILESFIELRERKLNLDQVQRFMDIVVNIIDQVMLPDQRTLIMERLEGFIPAEKLNK